MDLDIQGVSDPHIPDQVLECTTFQYRVTPGSGLFTRSVIRIASPVLKHQYNAIWFTENTEYTEKLSQILDSLYTWSGIEMPDMSYVNVQNSMIVLKLKPQLSRVDNKPSDTTNTE